MEDNNKDLTQDKLVDNLLQSLCGFSDEQLLKEFEEADQDTTLDPNIQVYPDEFDRIWEDICAERKAAVEGEAAADVEEVVKKKRWSWKKIAVLAVAATLATASICFVAVGKKSFFYREKGGNLNSNIVYDNDTSIIIFEEQEEAYELIEKELKIKPFKLGYIPEGMVFDHLEINNRSAIMTYKYKGEIIYFVQTTDQTEASNNHSTDGQDIKKVKNIRLMEDILVKKEEGDNGRNLLETQFAYKESFCWLYGVMNEDEFLKIVERIIY